MRNVVATIAISNRRLLLLVGFVLGLAVFGVIASHSWAQDDSERRPANQQGPYILFATDDSNEKNVSNKALSPESSRVDGLLAPGTLGFDQFLSGVGIMEGFNYSNCSCFEVVRTGGSNGAVSVQYQTTLGSATPGSDYVAITGTLTWNDGDATPKIVPVQILD